MHTQGGHVLLPNGDLVVSEIFSGPCSLFPLDFLRGELPPGSEPLGITDFDLNSNSCSSSVEESLVNTLFLLNRGAESQVLEEHLDQLEETNDNPTLTFSQLGNSAGSQLSSTGGTSHNPQTDPAISSGGQSYRCSWRLHDTGAQCNHVAPNRQAFLRHLAEMHHVSGKSDEPIMCQLWDSKVGSACTASIKRGNFPRHADTHYPLRHYCQHCPPGTSFSRQDSWRKHVKNKHPEFHPHNP